MTDQDRETLRDIIDRLSLVKADRDFIYDTLIKLDNASREVFNDYLTRTINELKQAVDKLDTSIVELKDKIDNI